MEAIILMRLVEEEEFKDLLQRVDLFAGTLSFASNKRYDDDIILLPQ